MFATLTQLGRAAIGTVPSRLPAVPSAIIRPQPIRTTFRCDPCDVGWHASIGTNCWCCAQPGTRTA